MHQVACTQNVYYQAFTIRNQQHLNCIVFCQQHIRIFCKYLPSCHNIYYCSARTMCGELKYSNVTLHRQHSRVYEVVCESTLVISTSSFSLSITLLRSSMLACKVCTLRIALHLSLFPYISKKST